MKKALFTSIFLLCMGLSLPAHSVELGQPIPAGEGRWGAGIHSGFAAFGLSVKYRYTDIVTVQGTLGAFGTLKNYGVRGLYTFRAEEKYDLYGFGSVGLWKWDGFLAESAVGFGAGAGAEYFFTPQFAASAELGIGFVNFDNYAGFSTVGLGLGLHYYFQ